MLRTSVQESNCGKCLCRLCPYFCSVKRAVITHRLEEKPDRSHFGPGETRNPSTLLGKVDIIYRGETGTTCNLISVHLPSWGQASRWCCKCCQQSILFRCTLQTRMFTRLQQGCPSAPNCFHCCTVLHVVSIISLIFQLMHLLYTL